MKPLFRVLVGESVGGGYLVNMVYIGLAQANRKGIVVIRRSVFNLQVVKQMDINARRDLILLKSFGLSSCH
jgi:hypothetical protein